MHLSGSDVRSTPMAQAQIGEPLCSRCGNAVAPAFGLSSPRAAWNFRCRVAFVRTCAFVNQSLAPIPEPG
jgi:hypothetical protein